MVALPENETSPLISSNETAPLHGHGSASPRRRALAYGLSIGACLLSASFTVFSLYTDSFRDLGYTAFEINFVSIAAEAGLYLCVPILGITADATKLSYLGVIGTISYLVGYGASASVASSGGSYLYMAISFAIIGVGCSAVFIASLVNCARLYPDSALLSISAPTTCYGLSSLLFSQVISRMLANGSSLERVLGLLGVGLAFMGIVAFAAPQIGRVDSGKHMQVEEIPDGQAISHIERFFNDPNTWYFLVTFVLVSGPLEMYQNNLGLIATAIDRVNPPSPASQVVLFSVFSTLSRLCVGAYTDIFAVPPHKLLIVLLIAVGLVEWSVAQQYVEFSFSLTSAVSGFAYGSAFTLYPLIVSKVWGIEGFATYWGMFILGPAVGSLLFSLLFAYDFDSRSSYELTFWLCGLAMLVSAGITVRLAKLW